MTTKGTGEEGIKSFILIETEGADLAKELTTTAGIIV
jgi:hypothetical protein